MRRIDALLVLMVLIWGVNYSVIKHAFAEIPPQPFNAFRLIIASSVFLLAIRFARGARGRARAASCRRAFFTPAPVTTRDRMDLALARHRRPLRLSVLFCRRRRSHERVERGAHHRRHARGRGRDFGAPRPRAHSAVSLARRRRLDHRPLLRRRARRRVRQPHVQRRSADHDVRRVLGRVHARRRPAHRASLAALRHRHDDGDWRRAVRAGDAAADSSRMDWASVSGWTWVSLVLSALLALNVAYLIWYMGVQKIGAARTSMFSNLVPDCRDGRRRAVARRAAGPRQDPRRDWRCSRAWR